MHNTTTTAYLMARNEDDDCAFLNSCGKYTFSFVSKKITLKKMVDRCWMTVN
jgi:hypothetical protein